MEAKDTVIPFMRIEEIDARNATSNFTDALMDVAREQAQISFEAGKQEGKREVVEWIKQNAGLGAKTIEELNTGYSFIPIRSDKWQAILKEWFGETSNL